MISKKKTIKSKFQKQLAKALKLRIKQETRRCLQCKEKKNTLLPV